MLYLLRHQKDFILWAAIWLHLWWGLGALATHGLAIPGGLRAIYQLLGLSVTLWSLLFVGAALLALAALVWPRLPRFWLVLLICPQQFLLLLGMAAVYVPLFQGPVHAWLLFWFLPAAVPFTVFHSARLLLLAMDKEHDC
jgi:hypothetical protein